MIPRQLYHQSPPQQERLLTTTGTPGAHCRQLSRLEHPFKDSGLNLFQAAGLLSESPLLLTLPLFRTLAGRGLMTVSGQCQGLWEAILSCLPYYLRSFLQDGMFQSRGRRLLHTWSTLTHMEEADTTPGGATHMVFHTQFCSTLPMCCISFDTGTQLVITKYPYVRHSSSSGANFPHFALDYVALVSSRVNHYINHFLCF